MAGSLLEKNLLALAKRSPDAAKRIEAAQPYHDELFKAQDGAVSIALPTVDGRRVRLHSRFEPVEEARRLLESIEYAPLQMYMVYGMGLGYHLREMLPRIKKGCTVFVVEKDARLARTALETLDLSDVLSSTHFIFMIDVELEKVYDTLRPYLNYVFASKYTPVYLPAHDLDRQYYAKVKEELFKFIKVGAFIVRTSLVLARANLENRLENIGDYVLSQGIQPFKDRFKGRPAVLVMAGPSLAKNIHLLDSIHGHAPILSVMTTFKLLLKKKIEHEFTAVLDFQRLSKPFVSELPPDVDVSMICDAKGNWEAIGAYQGPKLFVADPFIDQLLQGMNLDMGWIQGGGTVAHTVFNFANYLGADPIILIGQDYAYSDGITHIPGTMYYSWWAAETNRFMHNELIEWKFVRREREKLMDVRDWKGKKVYTTEYYMTYAREMETMIAKSQSTVIDATEGGAIIAGTKLMTLREAMDRYMQQQLPQELFAFPAYTTEQKQRRLQAAVDEIKQAVKALEEMDEIYGRVLNVLSRIRNRLNQGKDVNSLVGEAQIFNVTLERYRRYSSLLEQLATSDQFDKDKKDIRIEAMEEEGLPKQLAQLERDRDFVDALQNAGRHFRKILRRALERMERRLEQMHETDRSSSR